MKHVGSARRKAKQYARLSSRNSRADYQLLEPRQLLATFVVDISIDDGGTVNDGRISLREAVIAANTNAPFGDAPAGDAGNDQIIFAPWLNDKTISLNGDALPVTEALEVRGFDVNITLDVAEAAAIFEIDTLDQVVFSDVNFTSLIDGGNTGITMAGGGTLRLTETVFTEFGALFEGGKAVDVTDSSLRVLRSTFTDNHGFRGGAIRATNSDVNIIGSTFNGNYAESLGGALFLDGGNHLISNSDFHGNIADEPVFGGGAGGAILVRTESGEATVRIFGGVIDNNRSAAGGAISNSGNLIIRGGTVLSNNRALGFHSNSGPVNARGGAIQNFGTLTMVDAVIESNSGHFGGGVYTSNGPATFSRVQFTGNSATQT
ncbi:MAG: hypothetical protein AAF456_25085, partial [Planctomycetota bacterium]